MSESSTSVEPAASSDAVGSPHVDHRFSIKRQGPKGTYREREAGERRMEMKIVIGFGNNAIACGVTENVRSVVFVLGSPSSKLETTFGPRK